MKRFKQDIKRLDGGIFRKLLNISFWILLNYRISNFFYIKDLFIISKLFWLINRIVFAVDIDPGANLAGGLKLVHPLGIVVGREVRSYGPLSLYQGTTLGGNSNKEREFEGQIIRQPHIQENVIIYTSAVVIGPIVLGKDSIIGSNSTVTKDVPEKAVIVSYNKQIR